MNTYGTLRLTETSPIQTFTEVLTTATVKSYLGLPPARSPVDETENSEIELFITAAREKAEILQNRDLVRKQWDLWFDYWPGCEIPTRAPLVSVDLVKYRDSDGNYTTLVANTDYIVDTSKEPGIVLPPYNESWPTFTAWPSSAVLVRFTSGYQSTDAFWSDAGARIKNGMLLLISEWFNNKLPLSYDIANNAKSPILDRIVSLLSYGALTR